MRAWVEALAYLFVAVALIVAMVVLMRYVPISPPKPEIIYLYPS